MDLLERACPTCGHLLSAADNGAAGYTYCPHCDRAHTVLAIHCDWCRASPRTTPTPS